MSGHLFDESQLSKKCARDVFGPGFIIDDMTSTQKAETRTLTVVLNEADWRAFRAVEPDAVGWLHQRIQERLAPMRAAGQAPSAPAPLALSEFED
jgi:hypothetical protein